MPRPDAAVGRNRDRFEFELDTENCLSSGTNNSEKGVDGTKYTFYTDMDAVDADSLLDSTVVTEIGFLRIQGKYHYNACIWFVSTVSTAASHAQVHQRIRTTGN